jgi:hypothetical protein
VRTAITKTGFSAFADIARDILSGRALIWLAVSGESGGVTSVAVASTCLQQTDAGKICVITACAGTNMPRWLPLISRIEAYAKEEGCACVRIFGRRGWLRVLEGYREKHIILDKELH